MRADQRWVSIPGLVRARAEDFTDQEALVDEGGALRLSFRELSTLMLRSTRAAIAAGLEPGERASVWAPNLHEWIAAALGVLGAGGVLVPLNTRFKGAEAAYVLGKARARMLFTVTDFLETDYVAMLRDSDADLPSLERIVVLRGTAPAETVGFEEYLAAGERVSEEEATGRLEAIRSDDLSDIIFTSGTTGRPKGAMVTHGQSLRVYEAWTDVIGLREGDRYLIVNPFFHTFGYKAGWMSCILRGATIVPFQVFDVPKVLDAVQRERISVLPGPPTLLQSILDFQDRASYDLSSLRLTVTGAAAVPVKLIERLRDEMTIPDTELRTIDDAGGEVGAGEPGEVVVRGYHVMQGYFEEPDETAATIDPDGWLHTGDIGVMDDRGYVRITDRKKDMFIVGGFNAYPAEIENLLLHNDELAQAAVVGVPDDRMGEVGMAFVVPRPGVSVDADAVIGWARVHMANYKVPRYVEVVDALPLNASGKVLKYELRERGRARVG